MLHLIVNQMNSLLTIKTIKSKIMLHLIVDQMILSTSKKNEVQGNASFNYRSNIELVY